LIGVDTEERAAEVLDRLGRAVVLAVSPRTARDEAMEAMTPAEVDRRLERQRLPDLVDVAMFCKILGEEGSLLSKARLYQLREQQPDDFPRAVTPGVWLRSMAEHYSDTRNRLAGRPPRTHAPEGHHPACATCGHAVLKHGT
jgi:hypothetical protein